MGRSVFENVLKEVMDDWTNKSYHKLYLYGPSRVNKSHLLVAIVLYLTQQGQHIVYIPDCCAALDKPLQYIQDALLFAYHNDNDSCNAIIAAKDADGLMGFMWERPTEELYVIVDQLNALELNWGR